MIILDTNAFAHVRKKDVYGLLIETLLARSPDREVWITSVTAYEFLKGSMALISRVQNDPNRVVAAYSLFDDVIAGLTTWKTSIASYGADAQRIYLGFSPKVRRLNQDARIGAIALHHDAEVWTRNLKDFTQIPGLAVVDAVTGRRIAP